MNKRVLVVQNFGCARSLKLIQAMNDLGWRMSLIQKGNKLPTWGFDACDLIMSMGDEKCDTCWKECLDSVVNDLPRFDLVHSSNTPDIYSLFLVTVSKIPVIHDCHDVMTTFSHISPEAGKAELIIAERADGLIFVSEGQRNYMLDTYRFDKDKSIVFPNYYLGKYVSKHPMTKLSDLDGEIHLVYEGGTLIKGESIASQWSAHRDLWQLFKMLVKQGIHVHIYSAIDFDPRKGHYFPFVSPLLHWNNSVTLPTLMRELTQFDAGIIAFDRTYETFIDHALPNKMFEYLGAGIPVLSDDAREVSEWLTKYQVGEPILAKWHEEKLPKITFENIDPYISNVEKLGPIWSMEANIAQLERFYERVARRGR